MARIKTRMTPTFLPGRRLGACQFASDPLRMALYVAADSPGWDSDSDSGLAGSAEADRALSDGGWSPRPDSHDSEVPTQDSPSQPPNLNRLRVTVCRVGANSESQQQAAEHCGNLGAGPGPRLESAPRLTAQNEPPEPP